MYILYCNNLLIRCITCTLLVHWIWLVHVNFQPFIFLWQKIISLDKNNFVPKSFYRYFTYKYQCTLQVLQMYILHCNNLLTRCITCTLVVHWILLVHDSTKPWIRGYMWFWNRSFFFPKNNVIRLKTFWTQKFLLIFFVEISMYFTSTINVHFALQINLLVMCTWCTLIVHWRYIHRVRAM